MSQGPFHLSSLWAGGLAPHLDPRPPPATAHVSAPLCRSSPYGDLGSFCVSSSTPRGPLSPLQTRVLSHHSWRQLLWRSPVTPCHQSSGYSQFKSHSSSTLVQLDALSPLRSQLHLASGTLPPPPLHHALTPPPPPWTLCSSPFLAPTFPRHLNLRES